MYENFLKKLMPNDTILTVNQRLAAFLQTEYAYLTLLDKKIWPTIDILPFTSWLERCWHQLLLNTDTEPGLLLNTNQEQALWEQIIKTSTEAQQLLSISATAQTARQAWQLAKQWLLDINHPAYNQTQDTEAWQIWAKKFKSTCHAKNWLDHASLPNYLMQLANEKKLALSNRLFLVGFDEINPQYQTLLDTLGCEYEIVNIQTNPSQIYNLCLTDTEHELITMARWAYSLWEKKVAPIGCIVPNLLNIRNQVVKIFTEVFTAQTQLSTNRLPFNIAGGIALKEYPIIQTALAILQLDEIIEVKRFSSLLRSPYLGFAEQEMLARAELDVALKSIGEYEVAWQQLIAIAKKTNCQQLANLMHKLSPSVISAKKVKEFEAPSKWAMRFAHQLQLLGWPGERSLNSTEYQLVERWKQLLEEFTTLDSVCNKIDRISALQRLYTLATNTLFQPQSADSPIQILGTLEASGFYFDQLWIMGLDDRSWPTIPHPNPFIPYSLQHELNMPHANNERELKFARLVTDRLIHSTTKNVIISYSKQNADQMLQPSRLIPRGHVITEGDLQLQPYQSTAEKIFNIGEMEFVEDNYGPKLAETEKLLGGTAIFKMQASCPFQAFARFRLHAKDIDQPIPGLNARERGSLLHKALEAVWNLIGSQENLLSYSDKELQKVILKAINISLTSFIKRRPLTFKQQFTALEKIRLERLLMNWLKLEKARPPFKIVATEKATEYQLANIPIKIRVDRIDELDNGMQIVIDYKTGNTTIDHWFGERPDEPQLPIYSITNEQSIKALAFAQIRSHSAKFKGVSSFETNIPGVIPIDNYKNENGLDNWQVLLQHWQKVLQNLGEQFSQGYAKIDPKNALSCTHCDLSILCRVGDLNNE